MLSRDILGLSVLILLYTGIRVGELCALRWKDFSEPDRTLSISKTRNTPKNRKGASTLYSPNENVVKNCHSRVLFLDEKAHGISFEEAAEIFSNPDTIIEYDEDHSDLEDRWNAIGYSTKQRALIVCHCYKENNIIYGKVLAGYNTLKLITLNLMEKEL